MTNRRSFLRNSVLSGAALATSSPLISQAAKAEAPAPTETLVKTLYDSLNDAQREALVFPFNHGLRTKISNNWHITEQRIDNFLDDDQNAMVHEIFLKAHSEEYADQVIGQVKHDSGKRGFGDSSIAIFGEPDTGEFQFVLTGRHCTRRVDGDSVKGKAFGGPIFYGHAAESFNEGPEHKGNAYWYKAKSANQVYQMLDGKQREAALLSKSPGDNSSTIRLKKNPENLPGLSVSDMTSDQVDGVKKVLEDLLMPFREEDRAESIKLIEKAGFDDLHLSFYNDADIGNDEVWDNWKLEGPHMV
ncbi:MAG: DUF3500 domain-containing protein [Verrucomicrobiales bacterium]|nr:DUF3500 domain-containing protein [Verrucomicrobiales bacterium]